MTWSVAGVCLYVVLATYGVSKFYEQKEDIFVKCRHFSFIPHNFVSWDGLV